MKKIGILTFHKVYSYGATLQCFALARYLTKIGFDAKIIDYSINGYLELRKKGALHKAVECIKKLFKPSMVKHKINAILINRHKTKYKKQLFERNRRFEVFWSNQFCLTSKEYCLHSALKNNPPFFDIYVCGSDQIWNPNFCDRDDNYFLSFAPKMKKIAYAPSFGVQVIPCKFSPIYKKRLESFEFLSIRENSGAKIIKQLTGRNVPVVIDPTFLLDRTEWSSLTSKSDVDLPEKYVLIYFIGYDKNVKSYINMIQHEFPNYKIVNLIFDECCYGPYDFLKMIQNASFVFTNSFHGIALSINMEVPFAVGKTLKDSLKGNGFARIEDLLKSLDLSNRIFEKGMCLGEDWLDLDFSAVNCKKNKWIELSKKFLKNSIEKCES